MAWLVYHLVQAKKVTPCATRAWAETKARDLMAAMLKTYNTGTFGNEDCLPEDHYRELQAAIATAPYPDLEHLWQLLVPYDEVYVQEVTLDTPLLAFETKLREAFPNLGISEPYQPMNPGARWWLSASTQGKGVLIDYKEASGGSPGTFTVSEHGFGKKEHRDLPLRVAVQVAITILQGGSP